MGTRIDYEEGVRFGKLTTTGRSNNRVGGIGNGLYWECKCDCGTTKWVCGHSLRKGLVASCGCGKGGKKGSSGRPRSLESAIHVGDKYGSLTITRVYRDEKYNLIVDANCDCGGVATSKKAWNVMNGKTLSCGCLFRKTVFGLEDPISRGVKRVMKTYVYGAKNRSLEFLLTYEQFRDLILAPCFFCGSSPAYDYRHRIKRNGIDRYINSIGYVESNAVSCCKSCNRMKGEMDGPEFFEHISRIQKFHDLQQISQ